MNAETESTGADGGGATRALPEDRAELAGDLLGELHLLCWMVADLIHKHSERERSEGARELDQMARGQLKRARDLADAAFGLIGPEKDWGSLEEIVRDLGLPMPATAANDEGGDRHAA